MKLEASCYCSMRIGTVACGSVLFLVADLKWRRVCRETGRVRRLSGLDRVRVRV